MRCQPFRVNERLHQRINGALTARSLLPVDRAQLERTAEAWWAQDSIWDDTDGIDVTQRAFIYGFLDAIPAEEVGYVGG